MRRLTMMAVAAALAAAGCSDVTGNRGDGRTSVYITDSPFPYQAIARVDVHVVRLEASTNSDTLPGSSGPEWVTLVEPRRTVNLLEYQRGATTLLGDVALPAGRYNSLKLVIDPSRSSITGTDGRDWPVNWYTESTELAVYAFVYDPLTVSSAGARIVIDFDVGRSFRQIGDGFVFTPWLRAVNEAATGFVTGTVRLEGSAAPFQNVAVSAYAGASPGQGSWAVATGRSDAQGRYAIAFLPEGSYWLKFEAAFESDTGLAATCVIADSVYVGVGGTTNLDVALPAAERPCEGGTVLGGDTLPPVSGGRVASVSVSVSPSSPVVGDSAYAVAVLRDSTGAVLSGRPLTWSVSDTAVAGIVAVAGDWLHWRALRPGPVVFTATSEGTSGTLAVTIASNPGPVETVLLSVYPRSPVEGGTGYYVDAELRDAAGRLLSGRAVSWSVSDATVARLDPSTGVRVYWSALKAGTVTFGATSEGKSGQSTISIAAVSGAPVETVSVALSPAGGPVAVGDSGTAEATLRDAAGNTLLGRPVSWTVSDSAVVIVTPTTGEHVYWVARAAGTATITATSGTKTGSATLTVQ